MPVDLSRDVSGDLRRWRRLYRLTQSEAAQSLRMPLNTLQAWEINSRGCALPGLLRLALTFDPAQLAARYDKIKQ